MQKCEKINAMILLFKIIAIGACLFFIIDRCFFEIHPLPLSPVFILSFFLLVLLNWKSKAYQKKDCFKPLYVLLVFALLFVVVYFRVVFFWLVNTFPINDADSVLLTLQKPFDEFAYSMVEQCLITTIPQTLMISVVFTAFLYASLGEIKKRFAAIGLYFVATMVLFVSDVPLSDYLHSLIKGPEKMWHSDFFVENYVNPDSVKIDPPEKRRNVLLIYLESLEVTFSDKEHGGYQDINLIPEITELAKKNLNFGKNKSHIGGGIDSKGSNTTFGSLFSRSLGIPYVVDQEDAPILRNYESLYKILNDNGYKQIFFQGNPGLYDEFRNFVINQKMDEVYGPDDLIQLLKLDTTDLIKKQGFKTVQDKETFKFATQILDTISEPFSLTFFTIDTHAPHGFYDPDCVKSIDENNEDELLKASLHCVSRELNKFLTSLKSFSFYENTTVIVFGDHRFMGSRLVEKFHNRKWINVFINSSRNPINEENRLFSDIDMFPTILSSINFTIEGNRLGLGVDLFSSEKTLVERIGLDSLNKEIKKMSNHLVYESFLNESRNLE